MNEKQLIAADVIDLVSQGHLLKSSVVEGSMVLPRSTRKHFVEVFDETELQDIEDVFECKSVRWFTGCNDDRQMILTIMDHVLETGRFDYSEFALAKFVREQ